MRTGLSARLAGALALVLVMASACAAPATPAASPTPPPLAQAPTPTATPTRSGLPTPAASPTPTPEPNYDEPPEPAFEPDQLAQQLLTVQRAIRDPALPAKQLAWMGHFQQLIYSRLNDFPEWMDGVLATLPDRERAAVAGSLQASKELRTMRGPLARTLPDWKIVAPRPIDELTGYYREAEAEFGVAWEYLAAIHLVETRMGRIRGLSSAGAQGPMQFMPATWAAYGSGDINDDRDAILSAARYLRANGAPGDMQRALFAYNRSLGYVRALMAYAEVMRADPSAYRGYHGWEVYYATQDGTFHLPAGWTKE